MKEPQYIDIRIKFKVEHKPNRKQHLHEVARMYLESKGVVLKEDDIIEI